MIRMIIRLNESGAESTNTPDEQDEEAASCMSIPSSEEAEPADTPKVLPRRKRVTFCPEMPAVLAYYTDRAVRSCAKGHTVHPEQQHAMKADKKQNCAHKKPAAATSTLKRPAASAAEWGSAAPSDAKSTKRFRACSEASCDKLPDRWNHLGACQGLPHASPEDLWVRGPFDEHGVTRFQVEDRTKCVITLTCHLLGGKQHTENLAKTMQEHHAIGFTKEQLVCWKKDV